MFSQYSILYVATAQMQIFVFLFDSKRLLKIRKKGKKDDKKSAKDKKGKSKAQSTKASRPESQAEIGFRKKLYSKLKIKKNPNFEVQNLNIRKTQLKLLTFIMNPIRQKKKRLKFMVKVYLLKT